MAGGGQASQMPGSEVQKNFGMIGRTRQLDRSQDFQPVPRNMFAPGAPQAPQMPPKGQLPLLNPQAAAMQNPGLQHLGGLLQQPNGPGMMGANPAATAFMHLLRMPPQQAGAPLTPEQQQQLRQGGMQMPGGGLAKA